MRSPWAFFAVWLCCISGLHAIDCDFGDAHGLLSGNALVHCNMDMGLLGSATVICPRRVNGTDYGWHPQPSIGGQAHLKTYVGENNKLRSVALSNIIRTESRHNLVWLESSRSQTTLRLDLPRDELFAMTERRLIFICGPRDLVLTNELQRHIDSLNDSRLMVELPWTSTTPLAHEISKIGTGLGVYFLYRDRVHLHLQGCGSRPSPLFAPDNEVTVDPITGTRSCVADPMSETPIGFLCEGRIEPADCMRSLLDENGEVVKPPRPHSYRKFDKVQRWRVARYFNDLALPMFTGECRCIGSDTGELMARIEIRPQTEYVCDISSLIERNNANPINGPWCSVVLHPGSTLTIRFPTADVHSASNDATQLLPTDQFEAEFLPKDLTTLRQLKTAYDFDVYEEISYNEALAGDALEMDVSQMAQGEVKLKYHADKPLALKGGHNSFLYHWRLKSTNEDVPDKIRAIFKLSLALTHPYHIIGSDRGLRSVFDLEMSREHCSVRFMGNGIGSVYECSSPITEGLGLAGIHCRPGEELMPGNCGSMGYDLYNSRIISIPGSLQRSTPQAIPGFQVFKLNANEYSMATYACMCVDKQGYETSRLVLEPVYELMFAYNHPNEKRYNRILESMLRPPLKVQLLIEVFRSRKPLRIHNAHLERITLIEGAALSLSCGNGLDGFRILNLFKTHDSQQRSLKWLPELPDEFHYSANKTADGLELVLERYNDSIVTTPGGFSVMLHDLSTEEHLLKITSHVGAILISKNRFHKRYVPMMFVCGKVPETSKISAFTGRASTSGASPHSVPHLLRTSSEHTWYVVEVDVNTTDPYMQGCGVTYASDELFKPETPPLYDAEGQSQFGCKIDLQAAREAAFYCPAPYVLDPPNCFRQVYVDGVVRNINDLSQSLVVSRSNHFVILRLYSSLIGPGETLRQAPPLECRCITVKGAILSTIQIENYYSK
ncbi:hypothetical protein, conserved [Babesia ovata]|uniref:6-Cys domain-containing protein n=1 Tax=Babesia ovata TaxID=189622 RepID=A0A2H6KFE4_9APIC|nr:uncharacterized protein BOVATA_031970 [Babesia ovata]GBE61704.1 hypothetical protein, conserved [Babesia ovata]